MFTAEGLQLLGLTTRDNEVLKHLSRGPIGVSALARSTKLSRTSLYPLLERLHSRGLVTMSTRGKRRVWKLVAPEKLQRKLFSLAQDHEVQEDSGEHEVGIIPSQESEYKVYYGKEKLVQIYEELGTLPRGSRLYGIQPNVSASSVMKKFPYDRLVKLNQAIKDRKIVVEAVLQENFVEYYVSRLKKTGKPVEDFLQAYGGRLAVTTHVPEERLNFDSEVMFYKDVVIIANWQDLVAVVIKNSAVAGLMLEFFESLKSLGKRVDQNPHVEEILKKQE